MASHPDIHFRIGQVVICDFGPDPAALAPPGVMKGPLSVPPEMTKKRPAVVVGVERGMSIVVPLSTSQPRSERKYHVRIPRERYHFLSAKVDSWIKADLVIAVSNERLQRLYVEGTRTVLLILDEDLKSIRAALLHALSLGSLTSYL